MHSELKKNSQANIFNHSRTTMDSQKIKMELAQRGFDFSMLANALGKSPSLVSKVAARKARSRVVAEAIAKALELPVADVFPDIESYRVPAPHTPNRKRKERELLALLKEEK